MNGLPDFVTELREFVAERDWAQFHDPKNLVMLLVSEVGELASEYRWISNVEADDHMRDAATRARIVEEVGDVAIAVLLLCDRLGLDMVDAGRRKLDINRRNYPVDAARGKAQRPPRA